MKFAKINNYLFIQISKYFFLILFIFLSVSWLLQITRLFTITNFMHIEIFDVIFLSLYLIPNLITVIIPFILIFGLLLCFLKLNKDNELIAILTLGLGLKPFKNSLVLFGSIIIIFFIFLNFYFAPKIYERYKIEEYNLRNTLDFNNMVFSNFLNLNNNTIIDFKKNNNEYNDLFISYNDGKENIVFAKKGKIFSKNNQYNFQLNNGFKISIDSNKQIEKLEFLNYILKIDNQNIKNRKIDDKNTFTIYQDLKNYNYLNIFFKLVDIFLLIYILVFFYKNNLKKVNFSNKNNIYFALLCIIILIINQILKNSEINILNYSLIISSIILFSLIIIYVKNKYEQN
tara:strand:- start:7972 stop:9000 length:1029 start_codon:yes stop_codon:yes gene_type:complete